MKLRHYQQEAVDKTIKYMNLHPGKHGIIALPTGSGKTLTLAETIKVARQRSNCNVLVLSHVKEILEQNYERLSKHINEPIGLNSAGLGKREYKDITVAGIQSVYRNPHRFKNANLILVDEAHLISTESDTMYRKFLDGLNRHTLMGYTATPFRMGSGYIYGKHHLFNDIVCDWTSANRFQQLVDEGYLSSLTTKRTMLEMDTSGIKIIGGDFSEKDLSNAFDRKAVTEAAIKEILAAGRQRKKWLIFAIDISHAEHIAETLIRSGIKTCPVHSKMSDSGFDRSRSIEGFKNGKYQALVNVNILTTGFDEPGIDLIAMLRPTKSPVLHVQSIGRGSRISKDKKNCLVLDFAGNTERNGPINNPVLPIKGKGKSGGDPVTKTCPGCNEILAPAVRICPQCGHKFKFEHRLHTTAAITEIIDAGKSLWLTVQAVVYEKHLGKFGAPSSVRVTYQAEGYKVSEYICIEHKGFANHKANHWISYRGGEPCKTADELLLQTDKLTKPKKIEIQRKDKHVIIRDASF